MVDIPDDEELVDYDGVMMKKTRKKESEEIYKKDPEEEPEPNNGLVNLFALHVDLHQPGVMIGWLEEKDVKLIFPYEVEGDKTPPPGGVSSNSEPPNAEPPNAESSDSVSSDSELEDEEADVGEPSSAHDSSYVGGLAPWALRRDL
ncbi:hypothetical protein Tco_0123136 [Tanacetum coccineum]